MLEACCWVSAGAGGGGGGGGGAIACIELAGDIDPTLAALHIAPLHTGGVRRRSVPVGSGAFDDAVVARWTVDCAAVMTHGGCAVVEGFLSACEAAGVRRLPHGEHTFIEAGDKVEAMMLAALARAQSSAAIDLLLDQPRRWRSAREPSGGPLPGGRSPERDAALRRLIEPALVVAVGPPNIGKSSLLNALAGRGVAVVADQPGTTRDHVGALIDLAGVVVRWVDTPGLMREAEAQRSQFNDQVTDGEEQIQHDAQRLAREVAARADVLVVCRDASGAIAPPTTDGKVVRVALRSDLGGVEGVDASVSVRNGTGLEQLVAAVREAVVPRRCLEDQEPWVFWEGAPQS